MGVVGYSVGVPPDTPTDDPYKGPIWLMIGCQQLVHMHSPPCSLPK
jgi:hypothetical protein